MPKYYTTGTAIRFYSMNTLTISVAEGYVIESVSVTTDSSKPMNADNTALTNAEAAYADDVTVLTPADGTQEIVMQYSASSGHWRVQAVTVTYAAVASEEPVEANMILGENAFAAEIGVEDVQAFTATETGTLYIVMSNLMYMPSWSDEYYESYSVSYTHLTLPTMAVV